MLRNTLAASALLLAMASVNAATVTQWNFNSPIPDNATATGTFLPSFGAGVASLIGGVTSPGFNSGVGSSDPAATDNSGWQTTTYPAISAANKTAGAQFAVSTVGFTGVSISYDLRHSNTSSRYEQVQYSLNGTTFTDIASFDGNTGDTWFNNRMVNLTSITGADNNPNFAFRVVSAFAPSTSSYAASNPTSTYAGGTWRFDMVTVSAAPIPEPETYALMLAGLALVGAVARRRKK